ncbi:hypothetical protein HDV63DRAFT_79997 [Trichoderma sp. SZMC 28014]
MHSPSPSSSLAAHRISLSLILPICARLHLSLLVQLRLSHGWRWPVQYVVSALSLLPLARRSCTIHHTRTKRTASHLPSPFAAIPPPDSLIFIPDCIPRFPRSFAPERRRLPIV